MNTYDELKQGLLQINSDAENLLGRAESFSGMSDGAFSNWKRVCSNISRQISEDIVRVAVVGPIKSGKSTFVNSLFRNDYLKRGAGVVTSIVTRIRCGDTLKASICFKPWDEINRDIEQGLALLPDWKPETDDFRFDLRKQAHREALAKALECLDTEQLITNDTRTVNTVLLTSYLKGYDVIEDIIESDAVVRHYENQKFFEHRTYAGDEVMAVYIKDIQLEINTGVWDGAIEIADCQGSDSPNPLHLAMIQDYLTQTNFIVYVISSRTGLRRADIRFLSMIKEMGIMDNMLFVVNCDFSEHESFEDFNRLIMKIREDVSLIKPDPEIFTLSALLNLFSYRRESESNGISERDRVRLEQWEQETQFADLSRTETERFESVLNDKLNRERYSLLLTNHIERLSLITSGLKQWAGISREVISHDSESASEIIGRINGNQDKTNKVRAMIRSTLDGAVSKVRNDIKGEVDTFFDERSGEIIQDIKRFVSSYEVPYQKYTGEDTSAGFSGNLYLVYQDFKQALDAFMTETVTPKIVGFIRKKDETIISELDQMTKPYAGMVEDALSEYETVLSDLDVEYDQSDKKISGDLPDIELLKTISKLNYKPVTSVMSYSARVRAESIVRFGFYNLLSYVRKLFRKEPQDKRGDEIRALKDGLSRMKKETVTNVLFHFKSYRENMKFQYFFKLVDAVANAFYDLHTERFQVYVSDLEIIAGLVRDKKVDREKIAEDINRLESDASAIQETIQHLKEKLSGI